MAGSEHTSKQFDAELEAVRARVLQMGGLVESQIRLAVESLISGDVAYRQHGGGHTDLPNWPTFLTFAGRYMKAR